MRIFIIACLIACALAEETKEENSSSTTTPSSTTSTSAAPSPAPKSSDKPQSHQHESALKHDTNQHLDSSSQESSASSSSEEYRQLNPDEVKLLLLKVVDENIDKDKDGFVTADELKEWLRILQEKVIQDNVDRQWAYYSPQTEDVLSWDGYYPEKKYVVPWERYLNFTYPDDGIV